MSRSPARTGVDFRFGSQPGLAGRAVLLTRVLPCDGVDYLVVGEDVTIPMELGLHGCFGGARAAMNDRPSVATSSKLAGGGEFICELQEQLSPAAARHWQSRRPPWRGERAGSRCVALLTGRSARARCCPLGPEPSSLRTSAMLSKCVTTNRCGWMSRELVSTRSV